MAPYAREMQETLGNLDYNVKRGTFAEDVRLR